LHLIEMLSNGLHLIEMLRNGLHLIETLDNGKMGIFDADLTPLCETPCISSHLFLDRLRKRAIAADCGSRVHLSNIARIPGRLDMIFCFIGAARNEIRSQPPSFAAKSSGCSAREVATRCFAFIGAHLSRRLCLI
jgi:hypothetical protein